jgi:ferredoxin
MNSHGTVSIHTDPTLLTDIRRYGQFDTTGCYQCGSCTISCDLVTDSVSFPRKIIRYALLGLRKPLVESLEPWVCHDCGDCSLICPREAEPRLSMMTVRRFLTAQYDWTGFSSKILASRAWYIASLAGASASALLLILFYHLFYVKLSVHDLATTPMGLEHMFPIMTYFTRTLILLPLFLLLARVSRIWRLTMRGEKIPGSAYLREAGTYVWQSVTHMLMRKCPEKGRWTGHWLLAFGVTLILAIKVFALRWFQTDNIYPLYHPQRWLGYLATACILYGVGTILVCRFKGNKEICKTRSLEDLMFPILLLLVALSGISVHILRYAGFEMACHFVYALHIVIATPILAVEMSFGKWSHMIYRPLALYFQAVKERARQQASAQEVLLDAV